MRRTAARPGSPREDREISGSARAETPSGDASVVIPGFRAGRLLARAEGRTVALVHASADRGAPPLVAVVARDDGEQRRRIACAAARRAVYGPRLVDVVSFGRGEERMLVPLYEYVRATPAARVLAGPHRPSRGEACTLGIALARACAEVGDAGWERRRLSLAEVGVDDTGRPRLFGGGGAVRIAPGDERAARVRMTRLVEAVVAALGLDLGAGVSESPGEDALLLLEQRLFDAAEPLPLGVAAVPEANPGRDRAGIPAGAAAGRMQGRGIRLLADALLGERAEEVVASAERLFAGLRRVGGAILRRRRLVVFGAGGAGLLVALALVLLPSEPPDPTHPPASTAPTRAASRPVASTADSSTYAPTDAAVAGTPEAAKPAAAALALLRMRAACLRDDDASCVATLVEPGSPAALAADAMSSDGEALRDPAALAGATSRLITRAGGAALVEITPERHQPVSVLVVRGETGWRLRTVDADR